MLKLWLLLILHDQSVLLSYFVVFALKIEVVVVVCWWNCRIMS